MTGDQQFRLGLLKARLCPFEFILNYYGVDFRETSDPIHRDYQAWCKGRNTEAYRENRLIDRYWLEMFLQTRNLLPKKWMATRLGMTAASLQTVLERLNEVGPAFLYHPSPQVTGTKLSDDLWDMFPSLRFYTPNTHDSFCRRLHEELEKLIGFAPEIEWCRTAAALGKRIYAKHWDAIAIEPVSVEYEVWLDLKKWMTLPPDRTSLKTFAENVAELTPLVAGTGVPEIPLELGGAARGERP
jgi:hypothetical protein